MIKLNHRRSWIDVITVKNETYSSIPVLHVVRADQNHNNKLPTIFFLHGFTSAKEHNLPIAYMLADKGFRVIMPDALHHGEREVEVSGNERNLLFWTIVQQSIKELNEIKEELFARSVIDLSSIGVSGTSMGAITTYGALTQYEWIDSAAAFMGTAYHEMFAKEQLSMLERQGHPIAKETKEELLADISQFDFSTQLEILSNRPLFIWHGEQDQVVPFHYSESLFNQLQTNDQQEKQRITFIREEQAGHKVSRSAMLAAVEWYCDQLHTENRKAPVR
ncbi:esterase [Bacillus sp. FJAT-45037]|uniref:esterase n=1 Tax=Bacillus sp. FJAT-45037 TaxID=2011007 RepID=UPI001E305C25|nr:esterase [Bacillus sp. FJAT-45037]